MKTHLTAAALLLILVGIASAADAEKERDPVTRNSESEAAVQVRTVGGSGTGVVAYMYGQPMVLTAAHIPTYTATERRGVLRTQRVRRVAQTATISDGETSRPAKLLGIDHGTDIAVYGCDRILDLDIAIAELDLSPPPIGATVTSYGYGVKDGINGLAKSTGKIQSRTEEWLRYDAAAFNGDSGSPVFYDGKLVGLVVRGGDGRAVSVGGDGGEPKSIAMTMTAITIAIKAWPYVKQVLTWVKEFREWRQATFGADGYDRPILARLIRGKVAEPPLAPAPEEPEESPARPTCPVTIEPDPVTIPDDPVTISEPEIETPDEEPVTPEPPVVEFQPVGISPWWIAVGPGLMGLACLTFFGICIGAKFIPAKES